MLVLFCVPMLNAQSGQAELTIINQQLQQFKYDSVIVNSDRILNSNKNLSLENKVAIYRMKAISHYSLSQLNPSFNCFIEILKIDKNFQLDESATSPKIVLFFNDIKKGFIEQQRLPVQTVEIIKTDTLRLVSHQGNTVRHSLARSMILPGWGHLYIKQKKKGLLMTAISTATLAGSIYFVRDCQDKEKRYLNEIENSQLKKRYRDYNNSYRTRNGLLTAYSVLWIYAQIDLLFFNKNNFPGEIKTALAPSFDGQNTLLTFSFFF